MRLEKEQQLTKEQAITKVLTGYFETTRDLNFVANYPFTPQEAAAIMIHANPYGYNEFEGSILNRLPSNAEVYLAREGSVCIYVKGSKLSGLNAKKLNADEFDYDNELEGFRIWWD